MKRTLCALSLVLSLSSAAFVSYAAPVHHKGTVRPHSMPVKTAPAGKKEQDKQKGIIDTSYREIQSLNLVQDADKWVGDNVSFEGTFVTFSPYALDYKGAMRSSKDYIAFLVQRPDVSAHVIPLSELKLIYPRKKADKVMDLENGDKVLVKGKVFSAALGDPWMDVDDVVILQKSPNSKPAATKKKKHELE